MCVGVSVCVCDGVSVCVCVTEGGGVCVCHHPPLRDIRNEGTQKTRTKFLVSSTCLLRIVKVLNLVLVLTSGLMTYEFVNLQYLVWIL